MSKKTTILLTILTIIIAFMDISCLPGILLPISFADVDAFILPISLNFVLIGLITFVYSKIFKIQYNFGFTKIGLKDGLIKYGFMGVIAGVISFFAFLIGLWPLTYKPTIWKILLEGVLYYVGVAIVEEFYVRGLFLNILEALFKKSQKKTELAISISSLAFGMGHLPGLLGMGAGVILLKVLSTVGMGLLFGTAYKKTENLWVPIIMHAFINICALPYCFTEEMYYPQISLIILVITYVLLGICSVLLMMKKHN